MKKKKVKDLLYSIRTEIIEEISETNRMNNCPQYLRTDQGSYHYGYQRGLTEAAMIMLERIMEKFPEEKED